MLCSTPVNPRFAYVAALLLSSACGRGADPGLAELSTQLLAATPDDQRPLLSADLDALAALDRQQKLGDAERRALLDLFRSAARDGVLDDDERALLAALTRDVVVGAGRLDARGSGSHMEKT